MGFKLNPLLRPTTPDMCPSDDGSTPIPHPYETSDFKPELFSTLSDRNPNPKPKPKAKFT